MGKRNIKKMLNIDNNNRYLLNINEYGIRQI